MAEIVSGLVIRYDYLWAREHDRGETTGRKTRPVCVQVMLRSDDAARQPPSLLFPITSQPPRPDQASLAVPEIECRRVGLRSPAWILVDEWNEDDVATSPSLASTRPLGVFGPSFTREIRLGAIAAIRAGQHRRVQRTR